MLSIIPVTGIGDVSAGDDIAAVLLDAMQGSATSLHDGDVLVITHKIVSKAEGRVAPIATDGEYRALVESEADSVLRRRGDLVITKTRHGFICANAGVDRSNISEGLAVLLPLDPDRSAHSIRKKVELATGTSIGVIISDTFGRAWRTGLVDIAIGASGVEVIADLKGSSDMYGRTLEVTEIAVADEIAAAADLVMGKATGIPAALVRGLDVAGDGRGADLVRPAAGDLFR